MTVMGLGVVGLEKNQMRLLDGRDVKVRRLVSGFAI